MLSGQLVLAVRVLTGIVFAVAAFGKLRSPRHFAGFVTSLAPLGVPASLRPAVAGAMAVAEAATVVLVALPGTVPVGLAAAAALLVVFCAGIAYAVRTGRAVPCHCFGSTGSELKTSHLVRNGMVAFAAAGALAVDVSAPAGPVGAGAVTASVLLGGFAALAVLSWDALATLLSPLYAGRDS
ncbi:MAG: MauE/DoxX family redox-associated membrane protein [Actinocatenispora sp.]